MSVKNDINKHPDAPKPAPTLSQAEMTEQIFRETAISKVANWIAGTIFFVPVIIIWILFFYFSTKSTWLIDMSPNVRGVLIVGIIAVPMIVVKVFIVKVAPAINKKLKK